MSTSGTRMGRPRQFDEDAVLAALEATFHERGYHATALSDLVAVSGLHKGSLYGAFGDKHTLFLVVLRRYAARRMLLLDADLEAAATPGDGIRTYLLRQAREAVGGRGCLLANSALELLPGDDEVKSIVSRQQRLVQERLAGALDSAWAEHATAGGRSSDTMARYLFAMIEGLWELGRTTRDAASLEGIVEATLHSVA